MKEKMAIPLEGMPSIVLLNNGDRMKRAKAESAGYRILEAGAITPMSEQSETIAKAESWRTAILYLPEARERAAAAEEIVSTHSYHTMSVEAARAFLRGLPTEQSEETPIVSTSTNDPRAARKAEIANSMASYNKDNGHRARSTAQPSVTTIDPAKIQRLAEIRLNALESGGTQASVNEAKKLRYALAVHSQTGMPLATVFHQLDVNTSKLFAV